MLIRAPARPGRLASLSFPHVLCALPCACPPTIFAKLAPSTRFPSLSLLPPSHFSVCWLSRSMPVLCRLVSLHLAHRLQILGAASLSLLSAELHGVARIPCCHTTSGAHPSAAAQPVQVPNPREPTLGPGTPDELGLVSRAAVRRGPSLPTRSRRGIGAGACAKSGRASGNHYSHHSARGKS